MWRLTKGEPAAAIRQQQQSKGVGGKLQNEVWDPRGYQ